MGRASHPLLAPSVPLASPSAFQPRNHKYPHRTATVAHPVGGSLDSQVTLYLSLRNDRNMSVRGSENAPLDESVVAYNIHVSSRYLDLTRNKLQLTRLPHLPRFSKGLRREEQEVFKRQIELLIDFWLESYDWRARERHYNTLLPQFRTLIPTSPLQTSTAHLEQDPRPLRLHFVHRPSSHPDAVPLLFCHEWPGGIFEVDRIINSLVGQPTGSDEHDGRRKRRFHVVCPSWPGGGFSEMWNAEEPMGPREIAGVFHRLMERLGYSEFVAVGVGMGFTICRMLALHYPASCLALYTTTPLAPLKPPSLTRQPRLFFRYHRSRFLERSKPKLSLRRTKGGSKQEARDELPRPRSADAAVSPHTSSYSLCDSPIGLLAYILDALNKRTGFASEIFPSEQPDGEVLVETVKDKTSFTPTEILDFTMLSWLPGPEAPLRYLYDASRKLSDTKDAEGKWSDVPLGVSDFSSVYHKTAGKTNVGEAPVQWAQCIYPLRWMRRHHVGPEAQEVRWPIWQRPEEVVDDIAVFVGEVISQREDLKSGRGPRFIGRWKRIGGHERRNEDV